METTTPDWKYTYTTYTATPDSLCLVLENLNQFCADTVSRVKFSYAVPGTKTIIFIVETYDCPVELGGGVNA